MDYYEDVLTPEGRYDVISVICCFNDLDTLNKMLVKSLENQNYEYELIMQDNTKKKYKSAAAALNEGSKKAKGEYLVFIHQDVEFNDESFLKNIVDYIEKLDHSIVGAAGILDYTGVYSNITHGKEKSYAGKHRVLEEIKVQTLDEVLIATTAKVFNNLKFDEDVCNDWHLYGVDLCLSGQSKNILSYVIPLDLYHKSGGKLSLGYFNTLQKLAFKHKKKYKVIYTTCYSLNTSYFRVLYNVKLNKIKINVKQYFLNS